MQYSLSGIFIRQRSCDNVRQTGDFYVDKSDLRAPCREHNVGRDFDIASHVHAATNYPWCVQYGGGHKGIGATSCGFVSREQCMADSPRNGCDVRGEPGLCRPGRAADANRVNRIGRDEKRGLRNLPVVTRRIPLDKLQAAPRHAKSEPKVDDLGPGCRGATGSPHCKSAHCGTSTRRELGAAAQAAEKNFGVETRITRSPMMASARSIFAQGKLADASQEFARAAVIAPQVLDQFLQSSSKSLWR